MNQSAYPAPAALPPPGAKTIGQILDRTFQLLRGNLRLFVGIAAVPAGAMILVFGLMEALIFIPIIRQVPDPPTAETMSHIFTPQRFIPLIVVASLIGLTVFALYLAAAFHAATRVDSGLPTSFRDAWRAAWSRGGHFIGLPVLIYLRAILPALIIEALIASVALIGASHNAAAHPSLFVLVPLAVLLYFAALVYGLLVALRLSLAFPASVVEGLTLRAAFKRSSQLTRGAKGRIFLMLLVIYAACYIFVLVLIAAFGLLAVFGFVIGLVFHLQLASPVGYVALTLGGLGVLLAYVLLTALTWAGFTTTLSVLYHDQRLRKDAPLPTPPPAPEPA